MTQFQARPDVFRMCLYVVEYVNKFNKLYINIYTINILRNAEITINYCIARTVCSNDSAAAPSSMGLPIHSCVSQSNLKEIYMNLLK